MPNLIKGGDANALDPGSSRLVERLLPTAAVASATATAPKAADSISITDTARRLAALQQTVASMPEIDAGRVNALTLAIDQGHYAADPGKIADRLLQLENDLAAASQRKIF